MRIRQDTAAAICTLPFSLSAAIGVHRTAEKAGSKGGILRPTIVSQSRLASPGRHPKILNTSISRRWPAAARATHADGPVFPIVARDHQIPERQLHEVRACLAHLFDAHPALRNGTILDIAAKRRRSRDPRLRPSGPTAVPRRSLRDPPHALISRSDDHKYGFMVIRPQARHENYCRSSRRTLP